MNICMFTNTYLPHVGGVARSVSTFAQDLRKIGHDVLVVAPTFDGQTDSEDEKHVLRIAAIQNFNGSDFSVRIPAIGLIDNEITEFQPDVIHSHHPFLLGDTALRAAERLNLPIIFTHHTRYEEYTHYVPLDSDMLKRFVIHLATEYANLCDAVIAPSTSIQKLLREREVTSPIEVLPTGIDLDYFKQGDGERFKTAHNIRETVRIIGHTGRLAREKNLPFLAKSVTQFLQDRPDFVFVVAGTGDAEKEIKEIFAGAGRQKQLVLPGILEGNGLADCYQAMDLFVFASRSETQGLVLMEAMAAGTPVIAIRASGVSDVVEDEKNGRILPSDSSVHSFADAIAGAFDQDRIAGWSSEALVTARQFSREKCAEKLLELYEKTISNHGGDSVEMEGFDELLRKIKVEWELLQEKASALAQSI